MSGTSCSAASLFGPVGVEECVAGRVASDQQLVADAIKANDQKQISKLKDHFCNKTPAAITPAMSGNLCASLQTPKNEHIKKALIVVGVLAGNPNAVLRGLQMK